MQAWVKLILHHRPPHIHTCIALRTNQKISSVLPPTLAHMFVLEVKGQYTIINVISLLSYMQELWHFKTQPLGKV